MLGEGPVMEPGEEVEVRYVRNGQTASVSLVTAELDDRVITVLPGDFEGSARMFRFDPENEFRWEFNLPEVGELRMRIPELLELRELKELQELENLRIRIPEIRFREFERPIRALFAS